MLMLVEVIKTMDPEQTKIKGIGTYQKLRAHVIREVEAQLKTASKNYTELNLNMVAIEYDRQYGVGTMAVKHIEKLAELGHVKIRKAEDGKNYASWNFQNNVSGQDIQPAPEN